MSNSEGDSPWSDVSDRVTMQTTLPDAPVDLAISQADTHSAQCRWAAPAFDGGTHLVGFEMQVVCLGSDLQPLGDELADFAWPSAVFF